MAETMEESSPVSSRLNLAISTVDYDDNNNDDGDDDSDDVNDYENVNLVGQLNSNEESFRDVDDEAMKSSKMESYELSEGPRQYRSVQVRISQIVEMIISIAVFFFIQGYLMLCFKLLLHPTQLTIFHIIFLIPFPLIVIDLITSFNMIVSWLQSNYGKDASNSQPQNNNNDDDIVAKKSPNPTRKPSVMLSPQMTASGGEVNQSNSDKQRNNSSLYVTRPHGMYLKTPSPSNATTSTSSSQSIVKTPKNLQYCEFVDQPRSTQWIANTEKRLKTKRWVHLNVSRRLQSTVITLHHVLLWVVYRSNWYIQAVFAMIHTFRLRNRKSRRVLDADVIRYLISTTLAVFGYFRGIPQNDADHESFIEFVLDASGFASPLYKDKYDNSISVVIRLPKLQRETVSQRSGYISRMEQDSVLEKSKIHSFEFNKQPIERSLDRLNLLQLLSSTCIHPTMHSFVGALYLERNVKHRPPTMTKVEYQRLVDIYDDMFLHGPYLNEVAHYYPGFLIGCGPEWMANTIVFNSGLEIPRHREVTKEMRKYSVFFTYIWDARKVFMRLIRQHNVPFDAERLFICSILHSIDHFNAGIHLMPYDLDDETGGTQLPKQRSFWKNWNVLAILYYLPQQYLFTNLLRDKHLVTPFYQDLYRELSCIDQLLTDQVTLSVSS